MSYLEHWKKTTLGDSCDFFNGKAHEQEINNNGKFIVVNSKFISSEGSISKKTDSALFPLFKDDIAMVMSDVPHGRALAKCYFIEQDQKYSLNQRICVIRSDNFYPRFLFYYLNRNQYFLRFDNGNSQTNLRKDDILKCPLYRPPLDEQKRIAAILDKADVIRQKRKKAIALTEELLRSTFLDMFGDPVANQKGWNVLKFGSQVDELKYGTNAKCSEFREKGDISVLRIPNIVNEKVSLNELKYAKLESSEVNKLLLKQDDLLFVRSNGNPDYIGRCALFEGEIKEAVYASYLIRARLKKDSNFYSAFIRDIVSFPTFRSRLAKEARTTAGNYNINTQGLKSLKLICPPKEKQRNYLKFRERITERLKLEQDYLNISSSLFNSLIQKAFRREL